MSSRNLPGPRQTLSEAVLAPGQTSGTTLQTACSRKAPVFQWLALSIISDFGKSCTALIRSLRTYYLTQLIHKDITNPPPVRRSVMGTGGGGSTYRPYIMARHNLPTASHPLSYMLCTPGWPSWFAIRRAMVGTTQVPICTHTVTPRTVGLKEKTTSPGPRRMICVAG
ncbi:hypothetical protein DAEQUDRAFT_172090 [Daedalea quercina L-15889]|uniref:Uncharacterized protein n=1 Tax=Daedalea quercina L-15889 TaxID=1314783 RepID=A0A165KJK3_9APHY|nr:hypothetical protein DAEQUDRAFT_172090 [Daedalea quercina L-15889]